MAKKWALSAKNLAMLGILDDFYDGYCTIQRVYEKQEDVFVKEYGTERVLWDTVWDKMAAKEVRSICGRLINEHISVFTSDYEKLYVNSYAFQTFSFLNTSFVMGQGHVVIGFKSFSEFLKELQIIATNVLHRWKTKDNPRYTLEQVISEMDLHISALSVEKAECRKLAPKTKAVTEKTLYIFNVLSRTSCYIEKHLVSPESFVADLELGNGQVVLPVHHCLICERYFIGSKTLALFEKNYGKLLVEKKLLCEDGDFDAFKIESKLHQLGYNVIDGKMTEQERIGLLVNLLEHQCITYLEICATLEQNIRLFQNSDRHQLAVGKWKKDLKVIGEYILGIEEKEKQ